MLPFNTKIFICSLPVFPFHSIPSTSKETLSSLLNANVLPNLIESCKNVYLINRNNNSFSIN